MVLQAFVRRLDRNEKLDGVARQVDAAVRPVLTRPPVSQALSGAWLGHRLHPALTDVVIGAWLSATAIDVVGDDDGGADAARRLVGLGIVSALPTAAAGLHDWLDENSHVRRTGVVHALSNTVALTLQVASWRARRNGTRGRGVALSGAAMVAAMAGAYLGGHLTYVLGGGVARTAFTSPVQEWKATRPLVDLVEGEPQVSEVDGVRVLLVRHGDDVLALADACNHAGCSLRDGEIDGTAVTCACHGSRFDLRSGAVLAGPAAAVQPAYETRVREGMVEVRGS